MKQMLIESYEDIRTDTRVYTVNFFGLLWKKWHMPNEWKIINRPFPLWLRLCFKWTKFWCKHKWQKYGYRRMDGLILGDFNTFRQEYQCNLCGEIKEHVYRSEF